MQGASLFYLGQYKESLEWFDKAFQNYPKDLNTIWNKGESLIQLGLYEESIVIQDLALQINPQCQHSLSNKGDCLFELGKFEESIVWYDKALRVNPKNQQALEGKGQSLSSLGQYQESIEYFDQALENDPKVGDSKIIKFLLINLTLLEYYEESQIDMIKHSKSTQRESPKKLKSQLYYLYPIMLQNNLHKSHQTF